MNKTIKTLFTVTLAVVSGFLLFSCNDAAELCGTWNTCGLIKDGIAQEIVVSTINFEEIENAIQVFGDSGVNLFNGTVKTKKGTIEFNHMGSTKMMGSPAEMEFEDMFLEAIANADSYSLENGLLTITSSSKNISVQFRQQ